MSDALAVSRREPLRDTIGSLSGYGWTARLLGHYARDRGVRTLPQAIHRITGRPAERLGVSRRGRLREALVYHVIYRRPPGQDGSV